MRTIGGLVAVTITVALSPGCYAPTPAVGLECSDGECPDEQFCERGFCVVKSTLAVDAMPVDAPVETRANVAFLSDVQPSGNLGGRAGADLICQANAMAAGLPGTFEAFLTIGGLTGETTRLPRGWVDVRGQLVADKFEDFTNNAMLGPLTRDAHGAMVTTTPEIAAGQTGSSCVNWTSAAGTALVNYAWSPFRNGGVRDTNCSDPIRVACLEVGNNFPIEATPSAGRMAFLTVSDWQPSGGLAGADSVCQSEAVAAGLTGVFMALISTGTADVNRHPTSGLPWKRRDGMPVVEASADLFDRDIMFIENFISQRADGSPVTGSFMVWRGTMGANCNNWDLPDATQSAVLGVGACTQRACLENTSSRGCSNSARLICLEQ